MAKWVLLWMVAIAMGIAGGWWMHDRFSAVPRGASGLSSAGALDLVETINLSWWACHAQASGSRDIFVVHTPVRVRYRLGSDALRVSGGGTEVRHIEVAAVEIPSHYRDSLGGATEVAQVASAEMSRARQIGAYVVEALLQEAGSPMRTRVEHQLASAGSPPIIWAPDLEVRGQEQSAKPPFGISACRQREALTVDGVAYLMRGEFLMRVDSREGLLAEIGSIEIAAEAAKPAELRHAMELVDAALGARQKAQQEATAAKETARDVMAEIAELDRRRDALETQYLEASNQEDAVLSSTLQEQQALLDQEYERAQARIEDAQQTQIRADETAAIAQQQAQVARDYALGVARTAASAAVTTGVGGTLRGRLYLIEAYFQ